MKNLRIISIMRLAPFFLAACTSADRSSSFSRANTIDSSQSTHSTQSTQSIHPTAASPDTTRKISTTAATVAPKIGVDSRTSMSIKGVLSNYLRLKNALTHDDSPAAATAGKALQEGFKIFDQAALTPQQKKAYSDIADDAKEMAEHIGKSGGNLPHQREHFEMLSSDMVDLVKLFGPGQPLFVERCPMANHHKGAIWLSESKEIKNPYMGSAMLSCGTVEEDLK